VTQIGQLADDASFQFVDVRDLGTIDSLLNRGEREVGIGVEPPLKCRGIGVWETKCPEPEAFNAPLRPSFFTSKAASRTD